MSSLLSASSLIAVAALGLIVLYIYTLIGFAIFRNAFRLDNMAFCDTLYECAMTTVRYGLLGDINEVLFIFVGFYVGFIFVLLVVV